MVLKEGHWSSSVCRAACRGSGPHIGPSRGRAHGEEREHRDRQEMGTKGHQSHWVKLTPHRWLFIANKGLRVLSDDKKPSASTQQWAYCGTVVSNRLIMFSPKAFMEMPRSGVGLQRLAPCSLMFCLQITGWVLGNRVRLQKTSARLDQTLIFDRVFSTQLWSEAYSAVQRSLNHDNATLFLTPYIWTWQACYRLVSSKPQNFPATFVFFVALCHWTTGDTIVWGQCYI